jgi:hypothetical protein
MARSGGPAAVHSSGPRWRDWLRLAAPGAVLALLVGGLLMFRPWDGNAETARKPREEFAAERDGKPAARPVAFDGKRAMRYLEAVCKIGPRISGTAGMKKQQDLLVKHFEALGGKVSWQRFEVRQRSQRKKVAMANLVVSYHPDKARRAIVCSHYDTRPIADQEPNPRNWHKPFLSANDGGSGVAVMMELAHHMKDLKTGVGVDFVFFDGEEYIWDPGTRYRAGDEYFLGSKQFAREYAKVRRKTKYVGAVLLDMVGGKGATFPVEQNSWLKAAALVDEVWGIAAELKCTAFSKKFSREPIQDDHLALNRAGIPAVDIIPNLDDYPHWHRLTDLPKNCDGATLEQVGKVVSVWLQRAR